MLWNTTLFVAGWLMFSGVFQYAMAWFYSFLFRRAQSDLQAQRIWPKAGILLSLRGGDDDLPAALKSLLNQDYPDFELHIVVDSERDSAWPIVTDVVAASGCSNVFIGTLQDRPPTCSPHCASLVQAARQADTCEILALVDGDVVAPSNWLRTLVAGLDRKEVGMVHGNRWYRFDQAEWGSAVRYCWNSAAVIVMTLCRFPWGGSCAMRRADMLNAGVIDSWLMTLNQDNPARLKMQQFGKRIRFLPDLMILNNDAISLPNCTEFLSRQLLWAKLYSPTRHWIYILIHGWSVVFVELLAVVLLFVGLATANHQVTFVSAVGLAVFLAAFPLALLRNEKTVRQALERRGELLPKPTFRRTLNLIPAAIVTQVVYAVALFKATTCRRLRWRNVEYEILGPWQNRVAEDVAA
jgi:cellulose synthase/poly-beta-1,6-N-acetylglucosamine synthase-like glycosyltransferase